MEFHRTYCYLMEPLVSSVHWDLKWDRIPWNLNFQILMKVIFNCAGWINFRKLLKTPYIFMQDSLTNWCVIINICIIPFALPALLITYQNIIQISFQCSLKLILIKKFRGTLSRVPWIFWTHLNNTCGSLEIHGTWATKPYVPWNSMEFHGILSRSKVPWNSMELFPYSRVFHGTW